MDRDRDRDRDLVLDLPKDVDFVGDCLLLEESTARFFGVLEEAGFDSTTGWCFIVLSFLDISARFLDSDAVELKVDFEVEVGAEAEAEADEGKEPPHLDLDSL